MQMMQSLPRLYHSLKQRLHRHQRLTHCDAGHTDVRTANVKATTTFLSLPTELRTIIYKHAFRDLRLDPVKPGEFLHYRRYGHLSMLLCCKSLHDEIKDAMLSTATIVILYKSELLHLSQMKHVFHRIRHIEIEAEFLCGCKDCESSIVPANEDGHDLAWHYCTLSALPNLQTVRLCAARSTKYFEGTVAAIDLDTGTVHATLPEHKFVRRVRYTMHDGTPTKDSYFEGEFWKEKAEEAGMTQISWSLCVPLLMDIGWRMSARDLSWWFGGRWYCREAWVIGEMDYDECVLRLERGMWKYEYPQSR